MNTLIRNSAIAGGGSVADIGVDGKVAQADVEAGSSADCNQRAHHFEQAEHYQCEANRQGQEQERIDALRRQDAVIDLK